MHTFWPGVKMEGWELDGSIYPVAREHMGLQQLEDCGALVSPLTPDAQLPSRIEFVGCVKFCTLPLQNLWRHLPHCLL